MKLTKIVSKKAAFFDYICLLNFSEAAAWLVYGGSEVQFVK